MPVKTLIAAVFLTLSPGLALAQGCSGHGDESARMSCAEGTQWDAGSQSCVSTASS